MVVWRGRGACNAGASGLSMIKGTTKCLDAVSLLIGYAAQYDKKTSCHGLLLIVAFIYAVPVQVIIRCDYAEGHDRGRSLGEAYYNDCKCQVGFDF